MSSQYRMQVIYSIIFSLSLLAIYGLTFNSPGEKRVSQGSVDQRLAAVQRSFRG